MQDESHSSIVDRNNDALANQLRADARRGAPEYSAALHERISAAVRRELRLTKPQQSGSINWRIGWILPLAAAAAIAVMVMVVARGPERKPVVVINDRTPQTFTVPSPAQVLDRSTGSVEQQLLDARFGYLDQDVAAFAAFVRRTLPTIPPRLRA